MLKKALATFALMMAFPLASQAMTLTNAFVGSSTGNSVLAIGDTIQYEVTMNIDSGWHAVIGGMSLAGDINAALGSTLASGWAGAANPVTAWEWNLKEGTSNQVKYPTNGTMTTAAITNPAGPERVLANTYGFFGEVNKFGNGTDKVLGTVTITATQNGTFLGGAFMFPLGDFISGTTGDAFAPIAGASFTVIPEPGTALLMLLGLGGLGVMGRKGRN